MSDTTLKKKYWEKVNELLNADYDEEKIYEFGYRRGVPDETGITLYTTPDWENIWNFFSQELSQRDSYWIERCREIIGNPEPEGTNQLYAGNIRNKLRLEQTTKLDALIRELPTDNTMEKG